jgi:hypothetical protein
MQNSYLNHPAEEALERFLLHQCPEEELETIETHILACHGCVSRLEALETDIAAMKIALRETQPQRVAAAARQQRSWKTWFTVPNLSWAGVAAAIVAAGLIVTPQMMRQSAPAADISLSANRGLEHATVPAGRALHVRFDAPGLPDGPVAVRLVSETGTELWKGAGRVSQDKAEATAPKIDQPGTYFFRLYSTGMGQSDELLREFAFQVK